MATHSQRGTQFKLVQVDGYRERELASADNLEEMAGILAEKGGVGDADA